MYTGNINFVINARANTANAQAQIKAMQQGMHALQTQANEFQKNVMQRGQFDPRGYDKLIKDMQYVRGQYIAMAQASGEYATATKTVTSRTTEFNKALERQKIGFKDIRGNLRLVREAMREQMALNNMIATGWSRDAAGNISADLYVPKDIELKRLEGMRTQLGYYNKVLESVSQRTVDWGKNTQWAGRQLTVGFSVPITIAIGALSKFGLEADAQLTRIAKVYGDTTSAFQSSNESIRKMAQDTAKYVADQYGLAASSTREVMAELAATGMEGPELQGMTMQVQRMSLLGEMSPEDSLKLARILKEVYGAGAEEIERMVNYFNAIENSTALTMQEITEGLPRIAGLMEATGTSVEEQVALLNAFKAAGIDVVEGATALKSINFKAIAGSPTAKNNFLKITGEDMDDLIKKTDGEFLPMMQEIARVMETLDNTEQVDLIARVFGIHQGGRALTLLKQLTEGSEALSTAMEIGNKSVGELSAIADKEVKTIQESLSVRFKRVIESVRASMEQLGQPVLEMIIPIIERIAGFIDFINELPEGMKKAVIGAGLALSAVGPFIMFLGLMGNLIGMTGRFTAALIGLAAPFKILTPLQKAADLLMQNFATSTQKNTSAVQQMNIAINQLATSMTGLNKQLALVAQSQQVVNAAFAGSGAANLVGDFDANSVPRGGGYSSGSMSNMPVSHPRRAQSAGRESADARAFMNTGYVLSNGFDVASDSLNKFVSEYETIDERSKRVTDSVTRISQGLLVASTAATGLGMIFQNDLMVNIGMAATAASGLAPLLTKHLESVNVWADRVGSAGGSASGKLKGHFANAAAGMTKALGGVMTFLTGPWGLAVAAAGLLMFSTWQKHQKQIEETKKMYEDLANSAEDLGNIYDFMPKSNMDIQKERGFTFDENSVAQQRNRIAELRKEVDGYYANLAKYAQKARQDYDAEAAKIQMIREAVAQGTTVLQQTGDPELAKRAAWDAYTIMTGEWMSFDAFKLRVSLDGQSMDQVLSDIDSALLRSADNIAARIADLSKRHTLFSGIQVTEEDQAALNADVKRLIDQAMSAYTPEGTRDVIVKAFGPQADRLRELYQEALETGVIDSGDTMRDFIDELNNYESLWMKAEARGAATISATTEKELADLRAVGRAIEANDLPLLNAIGLSEDWANQWSGLNVQLDEFIDKTEELRLLEEISQAQVEGNIAKQTTLQGQLNDLRAEASKKRDASNNANEQIQKSAALVAKLGSGMKSTGMISEETGAAGAAAMEEIGDGAEEATDKVNELTDAQRINADAYRASMQSAQNELVDFYVDQFDSKQEADRKAFDAVEKKKMDDIESLYEAKFENMDNRHEIAERELGAAHNQQKKDLDRARDAAEKAMEVRHNAQQKALELRSKEINEQQQREQKALSKLHQQQNKAQSERASRLNKELSEREETLRKTLDGKFESLKDSLDKSIEARKKAAEEVFDLQIDKINKQIEAEERMEEIRQKMYENERERISRLQEMFSSNIDLNMAINSGDLDEAARISSEMQAKQSDWALQDVAVLSEEGSEARKDALGKRIERLEKEKELKLAQLEEIAEAERAALEAREQAERNALDARMEREREALDARMEREREALELRQQMESDALAVKYEKMQEEVAKEKEKLSRIQQANKEALAADFTARQENLTARQTAETESLRKSQETERKILEENRETAKRIQESRTAKDRAEFEKGQQAAKKSFDKIAEHWRGMVAKDVTEFNNGHSKMLGDFKKVFGPGLVRADGKIVDDIWANRNEEYRRQRERMFNDKSWETGAKKIADAITKGIFGVSMTNGEFYDFLKSGALPKAFNQGGADKTKASIRHSGGIIGKSTDDKRFGPGFYGKSQEVNLTALAGEGVLNLKAMSTPGVPELMYALNSGRKIDGMPLGPQHERKPMNMNARGDGPGIMGSVLKGVGAAFRRAVDISTLTALEAGYNKSAGGMAGPSAIDYNGSAGALSAEQLTNAGYIISTGKRLGASQRDIKIALMTAMQESSLKNINYGDDIYGVRNPDGSLTSSIGLFQQQKWWGSREDRLNPSKSSELFYRALFGISNRDKMPLHMAANAVQRSAHPMRYAIWEPMAAALLAGAKGANVVSQSSDIEPGMTWPAIWALVQKIAPEARMTSNFRPGAKTRGYGNASYHSLGQAVDIVSPDMMKTYNKLIGALPWNEAIYTAAGNRQMRNGKFYTERNPITMADHRDHIHLAYNGMLKSMNALSGGNFMSIKDRSESLKDALASLREMQGFKYGGQINGSGFGDTVPIMAEPGEFVMRKSVAKGNVQLLNAINRGQVDLTPASASLARNDFRPQRTIDNGTSNTYNINMEFSGPVDSAVDIESAVYNVFRKIEKSKPRSRLIR